MAFNGRFILNIAHYAAQIGGDFNALIGLSNQSEANLSKETSIVSNDVYNAIIESAVETTGDNFFGLHMGESLNLTALGLIGQITQTCETAKQALELCCQFANLGCSSLPMQLSKWEAHYRITLTPDPLWQNQSAIALRHTTEGVITFFVRQFRSLTRSKSNPIEIQLRWPQSGNYTEYNSVFGCPVQFNQKEIAILLNKQHVEESIVTADYDLLRVLVAHAEEKSARIQQRQGFASTVKQSVLKLLKPEFPNAEQVASYLNVSLRTLQRRLKTEGFTYKQLLDELRKEFALNYMKRQDLSIGEIAYLLNYSDNSTFTRSFKRWTGKAPNAYRAALEGRVIR